MQISVIKNGRHARTKQNGENLANPGISTKTAYQIGDCHTNKGCHFTTIIATDNTIQFNGSKTSHIPL